jgi:hypothetical protein
VRPKGKAAGAAGGVSREQRAAMLEARLAAQAEAKAKKQAKIEHLTKGL